MTDRLTVEVAAKAIEIPAREWAGRCHEISLAILRAGLVPGGRVARGWCTGVPSQHSWIAASGDCYARKTRIIDPTLWTYGGAPPEQIWHGTLADGLHTPHGAGSIWGYGRPPEPTGEVITLPLGELSKEARLFLELLGPLDLRGWFSLANDCPVGGWPAGEIYAAMQNVEELTAIVPIDRIGMLTDLNPGGLYF